MNGSSSGASATQSSSLSQSHNIPVNNTVSNVPSTINCSRTSSTSHTQICRFFLNKRTCPYGNQCRFRHSTTNPPICKHFLASKCHYGDRCKFYHPDPTEPTGFHDNEKQFESPVQPLLDVDSFPSISTSLSKKYAKPHPLPTHSVSQSPPCQERQRETRTRGGPPELQLEAFFKRAAMIQPLPAMSRPKPKKASDNNSMLNIADIREIEIEQLERLYPGNERRLVEKSGDHYIYIIQFQPSDPDWPYKITTLNVMISFPSNYPLKPCKMEVTDNNDLPISCIIAINDALNEQTNQLHTSNQLSGNYNLMFRPLLHWLDKYITEIIASCDELPSLKTDIQSTSEDNSEQDISSEENSERNEDDSEADNSRTSRYVCPVKRGTEVRLMGLQLSNGIATVQMSVVKVTMECTRCNNHQDIVCKNESPVSQSCTKCHYCMSVTIHSDIIHASNISLCFMDLLGCKPIDVILSSCEGVITCIECDREVSLKGLTYGQPWTTYCKYCHTSLFISLDQCKFIIHQSGQGPPTDVSVKQVMKKTKRVVEFSEGYPLPELGTCKHYKKSHRWLRFPCCGKVYPCDVCHDSTEDHPMERANRMICGYCSREQTYNGTKPCTLCGSDLAHIHVTPHWEGGQGCRNKTKMSRNDRQKYKNSTNKTSSMKNERVGVKGKANRAKQ